MKRFMASVAMGTLLSWQSYGAVDSPSLRLLKQKAAEVNQSGVVNLDSLLGQLPESWRRNFTLIHSSQSLQAASMSRPRIVLFTPEADMVMSLAGDPEAAGDQSLEVIAVDPVTHQLQTHSFHISAGQIHHQGPQVPRCQGCHGQNTHYIWSAYAQWPMAYGGRDDVLELGTPGEKSQLLALMQQAGSLPRYRQLLWPEDGSHPYRKPKPEVRDPRHRGQYAMAIEQRINARLGMLMSLNQSRAAVARMSRQPGFQQTKFALGFSAFGCGRVDPEGRDRLRLLYGDTSVEALAQRLGEDPDQDWSFTRGGGGETLHFYVGLWDFNQMLGDQLWRHHLSREPNLTGFHRSFDLVAVLEAASANGSLGSFFNGVQGERFWRFMQSGLQSLPHPLMFRELLYYVQAAVGAEGMLSRTEMRQVCEELSRNAG